MLLPMWHSVIEGRSRSCGDGWIDTAPDQFEEIGHGDDTDNAGAVDDDQAPDRSASHQIRGLSNRHRG